MIELYSRCKEKRSRKIEMRVNLKNNTFLYIESGIIYQEIVAAFTSFITTVT